MVMAVHFVGDAQANTAMQRVVVKAAGYGLLGVDLFFVLSGFLITGLLLEAKGQPSYFRNFYARRTLRIFPLYYFVLACLFVFLPWVVTPSPLLEVARSHQAWLWTYTSNFYVAATASWSALTYVTHFWSLAIEEHFYLLWPMVVFTFRRSVLERICLGVLVGGLALRICLAAAGVGEVAIAVLTPCRIDTLCVGCILALLVRREGGLGPWADRSGRAALGLGAAILVLSAFCATVKWGLPVLHQIRNSLYGLFFGALTLLSLKAPVHLIARAFQGRLLRFFGKYSYGLYVYHGILTWYFVEIGLDARLEASLGNHAAVIAARPIIGVGVSLVIALLSYHLLEKRFLALKRHFEGTAMEAPVVAPTSLALSASRAPRP